MPWPGAAAAVSLSAQVAVTTDRAGSTSVWPAACVCDGPLSLCSPSRWAGEAWCEPPSVEGWLRLLDDLAAMDVDKILPAHGDVSTAVDVKELRAMIADEYITVKEAIAKGMSLDDALKTLTFPQYKDWRNYPRLQGEIRALYELIQSGKRSYLE